MDFPKLSFPGYNFKIESATLSRQSSKIFDIVRKKYVLLTPEEWVRQHLLHFLVNERKFPQSLIGVEKKLIVNKLTKRTDVVLYSSSLKPLLIAECKAPGVNISQKAFDQAARYNMTLGVLYLLITNGLKTFVCRIDHSSHSYLFLKEIPHFDELKNDF